MNIANEVKSLVEDYNQMYDALVWWEKENNKKIASRMADELIAKASWVETVPGVFVAKFNKGE